MESGQSTQLFQELGSHETQLRGAGGVAAGDNDDGPTDIGHAALPGKRGWQQSTEFRGPGLLIACLVQQTL